jgi:hypothetical protein
MEKPATPQAWKRRGLLTASAVGLATAGLPASTANADASVDPGGPAGRTLADTVMAALRTHRLVAISESHSGQETHDLLMTLLSDPRLPGAVDDIIVEFGNALYQDTIDTFILDGRPVADTDLRPVWRDTTQSPNIVLDAPIYEQFYRRVRAVNATLPPHRRTRVLLGDPPFDWSRVTTPNQVPSTRNTYPASVIAQQVLAKGRRALLIYGGLHLLHNSAQPGTSIVSLVEQQTGVHTYVILDLMPLTGDPDGVITSLAAYPRGTVIPTAGTWLGRTSAGNILPGVLQAQNGQPPAIVNPWCGQTLGQLVDAGLYLGQAADVTASWPNPAIYLDPTYWAELQRRNTIQGNIADLSTYRQARPPAYPPVLAGPAC